MHPIKPWLFIWLSRIQMHLKFKTHWLLLWRWGLLEVILKREKDPVRAYFRFFNIQVYFSLMSVILVSVVSLIPAQEAEQYSSFPTQQNKVSIERKLVISCGPDIHGDKLLQMLWTIEKLQPPGPSEDWLSYLFQYLVQYST